MQYQRNLCPHSQIFRISFGFCHFVLFFFGYDYYIFIFRSWHNKCFTADDFIAPFFKIFTYIHIPEPDPAVTMAWLHGTEKLHSPSVEEATEKAAYNTSLPYCKQPFRRFAGANICLIIFLVTLWLPDLETRINTQKIER